ncbi:MAG TPA: ribosome biogenesis GTPase Der [Terriglobales bacterium]|nr:ribosome biogenesis GTPase Der [Terriglobales bacterium]
MPENAGAMPSIVIVGRPNVGKSTLFNRLTRTRRSIVGDEPGITRDRIHGSFEFRGRRFALTDTGGMVPGDEAEIPAAIFRQAQTALANAAAVLLAVDGRSQPAAPDIELARMLQRSGKPTLLVVNKIESPRQEAELGSFHELGLNPLYPVSAEHGTGMEELLQAIADRVPQEKEAAEPTPEATPSEAPETRIAIVGRPNVGKSTLLNQLTGEERSIVSEVAGTTRDAVDAIVARGKGRYRFVDTAGIRRKGATKLMAEKMSVVMARKHLEEADIALIVLDGSEAAEGGVLASDATIAGYAVEANRSCIIVVNKWDCAPALGRSKPEFEQRARERLKFLAFAPMVFLSAREGAGIENLYGVIARVARERRKRVTTAAMNRFLANVDFSRASVPAGHRVRIYYLSQVAVAPPQFVLFVDRGRPLHFSYKRFLENQIRKAFGFEGTPILLKTRVSGKRA